MEEKKKKLRLQKTSLLVTMVLIIAGLVAGYFTYKNIGDDSKQSLPAGWVEYKNKELGLGFNYPLSWGNPEINTEVVADNLSSVSGYRLERMEGSKYKLTFAGMENPNEATLNLNITSNNYLVRTCNPQNECIDSLGLTAKSVETVVSDDNKRGILKSSSSSYAVLQSNAGRANLTLNRNVKLDKVDASAVSLNFIKKVSDACPKDRLEQSNTACVTEANYADLERFINSIYYLQ